MAEARTTIAKPKFRPWRVGRVVVVLLGLPLLAHAAWGWHADRALTRRVEALRARGERILPDDFKSRQTVNLYENAARDLRAAAAIVDDDSEAAASANWSSTTRPVDPRAWPYLERAHAWFEPALRRVERAQTKPVCDWEHRIPARAMDLLLPELNGLQAIQNVLYTSALVEHRDGRDDLVVRRVGQLLYLADTCARTPASAALSVAHDANDRAAVTLEQAVHQLRIGTAAGHAPPADVRKLIASLLDETTIDSGFDTAMQAERMVQLDAVTQRGGHPELGAPSNYAVRPWLDGAGLANLERNTRVIEAVRGAADWPTARQRLNTLPAMPRREFFASFDLHNLVRRAAQNHFLTLSDRRLAATALAIRLYEVDHGGARPRQLDELVPAYLPRVPLDAMAAGGQPIKYLPRADHPVLYGVGRNGADDGGDEAAMPHEFGEINEWWRLDRVFYLSGRRREYIYIARPIRPGDGMYASVISEGRPPWERDTANASAVATQPAPPPDPRAQPALTPR